MLTRKLFFVFLLCIIFSLILQISSNYVNRKHAKPWKVRFYPKRTVFKKSDLIDKGCTVFIKDCPSGYKQYLVCARHYDGSYKTFNNYCEMEFDNCNGWRQWTMIKRERC